MWEGGTLALLALCAAGRNAYLGQLGLFLNLRDFGVAEIGYLLLPEARGRGLATRAAALVARWAFQELGIERLEARTHPENLPFHRVLERLGFMREGLERASRPFVFGSERMDCYCWSLLPAELR